MIKLRLDLKLKSRLQLRCDKHPRYNPERDGIKGYKAQCKTCEQVSNLFLLWQRVRNTVAEYEVATKPFETCKPAMRRAKATGTSPELNKALGFLLDGQDS